ncbi:MAG: hypothetical protein HWN81_09935 [Candidatus Lokiarchaeota archaeon]|nr:hypothetical protein [Candidatus Lokiarchaeota archaeon]
MSKQPLGKIVTIAFIGCVIFLTIVYDIFALNYWGRDSTISAVLNEWSFDAHPFLVFCLGMTIGGLIVHFFRWKP